MIGLLIQTLLASRRLFGYSLLASLIAAIVSFGDSSRASLGAEPWPVQNDGEVRPSARDLQKLIMTKQAWLDGKGWVDSIVEGQDSGIIDEAASKRREYALIGTVFEGSVPLAYLLVDGEQMLTVGIDQQLDNGDRVMVIMQKQVSIQPAEDSEMDSEMDSQMIVLRLYGNE